MEKKEQLLEIYKLHSELADRVSQRRDSANRLFAGLLTALVLFVSAMLRFGTGRVPEFVALLVIGLIGVALAMAWTTIIHSYKQLNTEKFRVLHDLEDKLPFAFFKNEWDPQGTGGKSNTYWKLTSIEKFLPVIFGILFGSILIYGVYELACQCSENLN